MNKKLQKYRAETETEAEADHKMPFYDETAGAIKIEPPLRGSVNIYHIIKHIEENIEAQTEIWDAHTDNRGNPYPHYGLRPADVKNFKHMKKTEGGYLYALAQEFEDDYYGDHWDGSGQFNRETSGTLWSGPRSKIYEGTLEEMMTEEKHWVNYEAIQRPQRIQEKCPCVECEDEGEHSDTCYHTDLCWIEEIKEAEKEAEKKRKEKFIKIVRALQIKIKEIIYSPHTRRGRAFIKKQIEWAFE